MTIAYQEFEQLFQSYLNTPSGELSRHPFKEYATNYYLTSFRITYEWAVEKRFGLTEEQACKLLYASSVLNVVLDKAYQKLDVGDMVLTQQGLLGTITEITPGKYLKLTIRGSNRRVRRHHTSVIKVNPDFDNIHL